MKKICLIIVALSCLMISASFAARPLNTDDPGTQPLNTLGFEYNYNNVDTHSLVFKRGITEELEIDVILSHKNGEKFPYDLGVSAKQFLVEKIGGLVDSGIAITFTKNTGGSNETFLNWLNTAAFGSLQVNGNLGYNLFANTWYSGIAADYHLVPDSIDLLADYNSTNGTKSLMLGGRYKLGSMLTDLSFTYNADKSLTYQATNLGLTYNF